MVPRVRRIIAAPVFAEDEEKTRVARLLHTILLSILFGTLVYGIGSPIAETAVSVRLVFVGAFSALVLSLWFVMHRGYVRLASTAMVVGAWTLLTAAATGAGGVRSPAFGGYVIVILSAGLLLGQRAAVGWALASVAAGLAMLVADASGLLPEPLAPHTDASLWLAQTTYFLVAAALLSLALRSLETGFQYIRREVTEREYAEQKLRASEAHLRLALDAARMGTWEWNVATGEVIWSDEVESIFGLPTGSFAGTYDAYLDLIYPEDRAIVEAATSNALQGKVANYSVEHRIPWPDGVRWLEGKGRVYHDESDQIAHMTGTVTDVTERKRAEEALRESQERFQRLSQAAFEGIGISENGKIIDANDQLAKMLDYTLDELIGMSAFDFVAPESRDLVMQRIRSRYEEPYEHLAMRRDGSTFPVEVRARTIPYEGRQARVTIIRDITARKRAEEVVQRYAERLEILREIDQAILAAQSVEAIAREALSRILPLLPCQRAGVILFDFEAGEGLVVAGYVDGAIGMEGTRFPIGDFEISESLRRGEAYVIGDLRDVPQPTRIEQRVIERGMRSYLDAPLVVQGELIGSLSLESVDAAAFDGERTEIAREVADQLAIALHQARLNEQVRRHAEELEQRVAERTHELAEANERLTELDRLKTKLVSDVSHELRTPVANLKLHVELLERGKPEKYGQYMATLKNQADRLAQLVEDTLDLSRLELGGPSAQFAPVNLNSLVESIVVSHRPLAEAAGLALGVELDASLPAMRGELNQLAQVVTNLVANAIQYTPAGSVRVRTHMRGSEVCLVVEDTGMGIDPEDLPHLFERFYRGRRTGKSHVPGSGLGLAIVKEIVDLHRGRVEVESEVGQGSTFRVLLPVEGP